MFFNTYALTIVASLALGVVPTANQAAEVCFPSCETTDARFLALAGGSPYSTLAGDALEIQFSVPDDATVTAIEVFDGDLGGLWDRPGSAQTIFTLFADPNRDGTGSVQVGEWTSDQMSDSDNDWYSIAVQTSPDARSSSGSFYYRLRVTNAAPDVDASNAFKLRILDGTLFLVGSPFAFMAQLRSIAEAQIIYPNYPELSGSTYDGNWTFDIEVPPGLTSLEIWDGDFDFGPLDLTAKDTDDLDTPNVDPDNPSNPFVPSWAIGTDAVPEGVAVGYEGATGNPPDDYHVAVFRRGVNVQYQVCDPNDVCYVNANPSGDREWERFRLDTVGPFDPTRMDYLVDEIPAGIWRVELKGVDLVNLNAWRSSFPITSPGQTYRIGDTVWYDTLADGSYQPLLGEEGIAGVVVNLLDADGNFVESTITDANGQYFFDVDPGTWTTLVASENFSPGGVLSGFLPIVDYTNDGVGDDERTQTVSIETGNLLNYDYGYLRPSPDEDASLGDRVWFDENQNGLQDPDEVGVAGVTVTLTGSNGFTATETTDDNGEYLFTGLAPGNYTVQVELPPGYDGFTMQGTPGGSDDSTDSNADPSGDMGTYSLDAGDELLTVDAGLIRSVCIPAIDFDLGTLGAGDIVSDEFTGVTIHATGNSVGGQTNVAMIFDTANPTGGDSDLGAPNERYGGPGVGSGGASNRRALGNVLIISEDLDSSDPDDDYGGGTISFTFDQPTQVRQVAILDIDAGETAGVIIAYNAAGAEIASADIVDAGNNSYQIVALNAENVARLDVVFPSSGAVAGLGFCPGIDIRKQAEGPDSRTFAPGEIVTFEIAVTNSGEDALSDVKVTDALLPACDEHIGSLPAGHEHVYSCEGTAGSGIETQTFVDHFDVRGYGNNDGTGQWNGDWVEFDAANDGGASVQDPYSGNVLVGSNHKIWLDDAPNTDTEPSIQRAMNLAGATGATLEFTWTVHTGVDREDAVELDISSDGGATWHSLQTFTGFTGTEINHEEQYENIDIGAYTSAQTVIRWRVTNMYGADQEKFKVDNVVVTAQGAGSGGYVNQACVDGLGGGIEVSDCDESEVKVAGDSPPSPPADGTDETDETDPLPSDGGTVRVEFSDFGRKVYKFYVYNDGDRDVVIEEMTVDWPDGNGQLREVKRGSNKLFDTDVSGSPVTISNWIGSDGRRTIGAGDRVQYKVKFKNRADTDAAAYHLDLRFSNGETAGTE